MVLSPASLPGPTRSLGSTKPRLPHPCRPMGPVRPNHPIPPSSLGYPPALWRTARAVETPSTWMDVLAGNVLLSHPRSLHSHPWHPKLREGRTRCCIPSPPCHQNKAWMKEPTTAVKHPASPKKRVQLGDRLCLAVWLPTRQPLGWEVTCRAGAVPGQPGGEGASWSIKDLIRKCTGTHAIPQTGSGHNANSCGLSAPLHPTHLRCSPVRMDAADRTGLSPLPRHPPGIRRAAGPPGAAPNGDCQSTQVCRAAVALWRGPCTPPGSSPCSGMQHPPSSWGRS